MSGRAPRALALALIATASTALAAPGDLPAPPAGWAIDSARSIEIERSMAKQGHFGGAAVAPAHAALAIGEGGSLITWRIATAAPAADVPGAVRAELDLIRDAAKTAALDGSHTELAVWQERVTERVAEAHLEWRHAGNQTAMRSKVLITATSAGLVAVGAECVIRDDAAAAARTACDHFLDGLEPATALADRAALAIGGAPAVVEAPIEPPPSDRPPPPSMREGTGVLLPPAPPPPPPPPDRRPFLIAGGALVLVGVLLWTRSRRRVIETDHGPTRPRRRWRDRAADAEAGPDRGADADGADADGAALAAAADATAADAPDAPPPAKDPP
jgi:hypothetical protein